MEIYNHSECGYLTAVVYHQLHEIEVGNAGPSCSKWGFHKGVNQQNDEFTRLSTNVDVEINAFPGKWSVQMVCFLPLCHYVSLQEGSLFYFNILVYIYIAPLGNGFRHSRYYTKQVWTSYTFGPVPGNTKGCGIYLWFPRLENGPQVLGFPQCFPASSRGTKWFSPCRSESVLTEIKEGFMVDISW